MADSNQEEVMKNTILTYQCIRNEMSVDIFKTTLGVRKYISDDPEAPGALAKIQEDFKLLLNKWFEGLEDELNSVGLEINKLDLQIGITLPDEIN